MKAFSKGLLISSCLVVAASAHATFYTDMGSFLAATSGATYTEDFASMTYGSPLNGTQSSWDAPGANGFGFTATNADGLWSNVGALSTAVATSSSGEEPLDFTFTGNPTSAFAVMLGNSDINGNVITGDVTLTMSNGDTMTLNGVSAYSFIGWVGDSAATGASVIANDANTAANWVAVDQTIQGTAAVPEPASMVILGLGALAALRRRKSA